METRVAWIGASCLAMTTYACMGGRVDDALIGTGGRRGEGGADDSLAGERGDATGGRTTGGRASAGGPSAGGRGSGGGDVAEGGAAGFGGDGQCDAGSYVVAEEPRVCADCPDGTFSLKSNATLCTPWSIQTCNWDQALVGSAVTDARCRSRKFTKNLRAAWYPHSVGIDSEDNVIVGGIDSSMTAGSFIAKLGPTGDLHWTGHFEEVITAIVVDGDDFIYSISNGRSEGSSGQNVVLTKYDSQGTPLRRINLGSSGINEARAIAVGPDDAVYVGGRTDGNLFAENQGGFDSFVVKYDKDGTLLWGLQFGGEGSDEVRDWEVGTDGGLVIATQGGMRKLSTADGHEIWSSGLNAYRIALDRNNDVYMLGYGLSLTKLAGEDRAVEWTWSPDPYDYVDPRPGYIVNGPADLIAVTFYDAYDYTSYYGYSLNLGGELFDTWLENHWMDQRGLALSRDAVVVVGRECDHNEPGRSCSAFVHKTLFQYP